MQHLTVIVMRNLCSVYVVFNGLVTAHLSFNFRTPTMNCFLKKLVFIKQYSSSFITCLSACTNHATPSFQKASRSNIQYTSVSRGGGAPGTPPPYKSSCIGLQKRQNAPFTFLVFTMFSIFPKYRFKSVIMRQSTSVFSKAAYSTPLDEVKTCPVFLIVVLNTRKRPCFKMISAVAYCFKYRQNTPFTVIVFIFCSSKAIKMSSEWTIHRHCFHFSFTVPNRSKYRQNEPFTVPVFNFSLKFHIVSSTVKIHHLPSRF